MFDDSDLENMELLDRVLQRAKEIQAQGEQLAENDDAETFDGISSDEPIVNQEAAAIERISQPDTMISSALDLLTEQEEQIQAILDAEIKSAELTYRS